MDREQLIRDMRNLQDKEYQTFGDMGTQIFGQAADQMESDDLSILALEQRIKKFTRQVDRNYGCLLLIMLGSNLLSILSMYVIAYFFPNLFR
jgi:hypothetical protein